MNHEKQDRRLRRILVPLDESVHSRTALEAAVALAAALQAELDCLYVEDTKLLELSKYPFFREVCTYECRTRKTNEIERDLQLQSERIRRMITRSVGRTQVKWSFEIRRGGVETVVLERAASADLTIMGRLGRTVLRSTMGSTVRHLILHGRGLSMFIQEGFRVRSPIIAVYTGSEASNRGLDFAANIARLIRGEVEILVPAATREAFQALRKEAEANFKDPDVRHRFQPTTVPAPGGLLERLRAMHLELVVLPEDAADHQPENVLNLINRIANPVLLVRGNKRNGDDRDHGRNQGAEGGGSTGASG